MAYWMDVASLRCPRALGHSIIITLYFYSFMHDKFHRQFWHLAIQVERWPKIRRDG